MDDKRKFFHPANRSSTALAKQLVRPGSVNRKIMSCYFKNTWPRLATHWTYRYDHNN